MVAQTRQNDRLWVVGFFAAWTVMAAGVVVTAAEPKDYTATAVFQVSMKQDSLVSPDKQPGALQEFKIYRNTQAELLRSPFVLAAALRKPDVASLGLVKDQSDPIVWLQKNLRISFPGDAEILTVSLTGDDAKAVTALVRAVVDAYMNDIVMNEGKQQRTKLAQLDRIYTEKENECRAKRALMQGLADQLGSADKETISVQQQAALQACGEYRRELFRAKLELRRLITSHKAQQDALAEQIEMLTREVAQREHEVAQLGQSSVDLEMMRAELTTLDGVLKKIAEQRDALRVELRSAARIQLLQQAEVPMGAPPATERPK